MREAGEPLYHTPEEIERLVRAFEACTLPVKAWTHEAHLTVALWFLTHYPLDEATQRVRLGIQRYNESCGFPMTRDSGYHETITRFYLWSVRHYLKAAAPDASLVERINVLVDSPFGDRKRPLEYYTKDRLMSWEARSGWLEPDIKPMEE